MEPYRVLIVDDHQLSRKGIATVLQEDPRFEVAGEAIDGEEALTKALDLMPDLILMDVRMPGRDGIETTRRIKSALPYVKIVMLSVSSDPKDFLQAMKAGAQGYLLKDMDTRRWLEYLESIMADDAPVSRELALALLQEFTGKQFSAAKSKGAIDGLTPREHDVLQAVAQGMSNREIADALHVTVSTVKNHLRNILAKLHLRNRTQLVAYAYDQGWSPPDQGDPRP